MHVTPAPAPAPCPCRHAANRCGGVSISSYIWSVLFRKSQGKQASWFNHQVSERTYHLKNTAAALVELSAFVGTAIMIIIHQIATIINHACLWLATTAGGRVSSELSPTPLVNIFFFCSLVAALLDQPTAG
ncbi:hypothetical protein BS78_03G386000 [Paspalum vaginatum]|nr:hypothetical protein BS78_03G386000 [Paspalum vaginatum]